jgi:hypothetical protein
MHGMAPVTKDFTPTLCPFSEQMTCWMKQVMTLTTMTPIVFWRREMAIIRSARFNVMVANLSMCRGDTTRVYP